MSFPVPIPDKSDPRWANRGDIHVRSGEGIGKGVAGDTYFIKAMAADTNGSLGFVETTVPPGAGPVAHAHGDEDEAFTCSRGSAQQDHPDQWALERGGTLRDEAQQVLVQVHRQPCGCRKMSSVLVRRGDGSSWPCWPLTMGAHSSPSQARHRTPSTRADRFPLLEPFVGRMPGTRKQ
jgi:hypothetical protein